MGCGSSSTAAAAAPAEPIKPPSTTGTADASSTTAGLPSYVKPVTEAELAARGFGDKGGYLGMGKEFYSMPTETDEEKKIAVAALANDAVGPVEHDEMDAVFNGAKQIFATLDKDRSGALELAELEPLCVWLFERFARSFDSDDEKAAAIDMQLKRFRVNGPPSGTWTFRQFEGYYRATIEEAEQYQLARNEAYAKGYDKSAAAAKFTELDVDGSQFLVGAEVEKLAEWIFKSLHDAGEQMSAEEMAMSAASLMRRLDGQSGNSDGKISFAEFDGYFNAKIQEIAKFKENESKRQARREENAAEEETTAAGAGAGAGEVSRRGERCACLTETRA